MTDFQLVSEEDAPLPKNPVAEVKYDGFMVRTDRGRLLTREGTSIRHRYPEIPPFPPDTDLVGELVVFTQGLRLRGAGLPTLDYLGPPSGDFEAQLRRKTDNPSKIALWSRLYPATLVAFDVTRFRGEDVTRRPWKDRQPLLRQVVNDGPRVRLPESWPEGTDPDVASRGAFARGLEGVVFKDPNAPYTGGKRSPAWVKRKCWHEGDYTLLRFEVTDRDGFVVYVRTAPDREQKVVVNDVGLQQRIVRGVQGVRVRYLPSTGSALRQGHIVGVVG